jgi:hypothetical protein
MRGATPPLPEYVFMAWCLVKHNFLLLCTVNFTILRNFGVPRHLRPKQRYIKDICSNHRICLQVVPPAVNPRVIVLTFSFQMSLKPSDIWKESYFLRSEADLSVSNLKTFHNTVFACSFICTLLWYLDLNSCISTSYIHGTNICSVPIYSPIPGKF